MANFYLTPTGGGLLDGSSWANAFSLAEFTTWITTNALAGDFCYVLEGTYTFTADINSALDGTAVAPISVMGVKAETTNEPPVYSDWALLAADRPVFACGAYIYQLDNYWHTYNVSFTGTSGALAREDAGALFWNCKANNTSGVAARYGFFNFDYGRLVSCEAISTNGSAIITEITRIIMSYVHDSNIGINTLYGNYNTALHCVIDTCVTGVSLGNFGHNIINSTIYGCTTGISSSSSHSGLFINNIINDCTTGVSWTTEQKSNFWDFNNFEGNGTARTNVTAGNNDTAVDPQFTNAAGGDFSLASGSGCIDAGQSLELGVG